MLKPNQKRQSAARAEGATEAGNAPRSASEEEGTQGSGGNVRLDGSVVAGGDRAPGAAQLRQNRKRES